ncbi:hypothetical protein RUR49_24965 [Pseudoxanthobacter sp. M-2]|uniref:hypothetical protein n=1 Tax=Pseudoxanthobacter sp. M-2 TaxID=3078754 RepID=UPI0038FC7733
MQVLALNRKWAEDDDLLSSDFSLAGSVAPPSFDVQLVDAGLGASLPTILFSCANAAALALAIFSAPKTIKENWPEWKSIYDSITSKVSSIYDEYSIDRDSAAIIAIHEVFELTAGAGDLFVDFVLRHYSDLSTGYEDVSIVKVVIADSGVEGNIQASRQVRCRYIVGVSAEVSRYTVLVEKTGLVSFCRLI